MFKALLNWLKRVGEFHFSYLCPKCGNGNVEAYTYGTYDQFEHGKCVTCPYEYDGFTEDYI